MSEAAVSYARRVPSGEARLFADRRPPLVRLDIELTERCNNDCLHCSVNRPAADEEARRREWPASSWIALLEEAAGLGCLVVRLTGGEPLLRDDLEEIYLRARGLGMRVLLFTNATLMTPHLARLLRHVPPLEPVEVSVYGLSEASYGSVTRRAGSFEACRRGLALLEENGVPFVVKGALLPQNADELEAFEDWASRLPGASGPPSLAMLFELRTRRDSPEKNELIRGLRIAPEHFVRHFRRYGGAAEREWADLCARCGGASGDRLFACQADSASASIDPYGVLQVCLGLRHPATVYDLNRGSLREGVMEFLPKVRAMRSDDPAYVERCGRCFLKGLCEQCPARSWSEHGTLDTPVEYLCEVGHAQAVAAGLLEPGEKAWRVPGWRARMERRKDR